MTLRARFTLFATALLAVALGGAFLAFERLDSYGVDSELDRRVLELARTGNEPAHGWLVIADPADFERPPGKRPTDDSVREQTDSENQSFGLDRERDGATVEAYLLVKKLVPANSLPLVEAQHVLRKEVSTDHRADLPKTGAFRLREAARSLARDESPRTTRIQVDGREFAAAVNDVKLQADPEPPRPPPPPHPARRGDRTSSMGEPPGDGSDGDRPPPPDDDGDPPWGGLGRKPPPDDHGHRPPRFTRPRFVGVAFVETAPARAAHFARTRVAAGVGLGALLGGALLAFALSGRMLRPIRVAATAAEAIEAPSQRLPTRGSRDELERLVVVLNGMLARLDEVSTRERRFLATASHELRRPLTALLGELELACAPGRDAKELRSSIGLALDDGRAMRRLVEDLLHHARAQAGALRLSETDVELADVVADAVARSRRAIGNGAADAARPRIDVGALPSATLRADPDALRQVLENLLVNGATHGGPDARVTISAAFDEPIGDCDARRGASVRAQDEMPARSPDASDPPPRVGPADLLIRVEDDGPGIPSDERARVFEPFGRGDRARMVPGFGMGLAIARDLVVAHGGAIDVASPLRRDDAARPGARFTVRWPKARVRAR